MMEFFQVLVVICLLWGIVSAVAIRSYLKKRGFEVDFFYARFRMRKYIRQYAEITRQEEGKPGFWHRSYQISMILALVLVVIGLLIN